MCGGLETGNAANSHPDELVRVEIKGRIVWVHKSSLDNNPDLEAGLLKYINSQVKKAALKWLENVNSEA